MNRLNNKYLKISLLLGIAFIISDFSIKNVFLAQSPKLNPFFAHNMMAKVNGFWSKTSNLFAFKSTPANQTQSNNNSSDNNFINPPIENSNGSQETQQVTPKPTVTQSNSSLSQEIQDALAVPLTRVSQGVYAGETNNTRVYEVKTNEIDYLVYTYNINGKEIKIKVPKDQQPPSQDIVEALYR